MKKLIAAGLAASLTFAAAGVFPASAAENGKNLVILGDSIAAGYGLSADEKNYGELLKDYYGKDSTLANFAVSGSTSQDWVNALELRKPSSLPLFLMPMLLLSQWAETIFSSTLQSSCLISPLPTTC